ncbi:MAG: formylglycine-generating enzyme [Methyloprofundus sp.]|nr:MAG: formylglycine-generating enzyme [Methyloprofundus sp.]
MNQPNYLDVPQEFPPTWASAYGQDHNGYWLEISIYQQTLCFRWIPKGKFTMGSAEDEKGRYDDEDPHVVTISRGFWLTDTVVTQALWQAVMGENPSSFQDSAADDLPVEQVSWQDAQAFIAKIHADYPALSLRFPWEAEWEYACRAGTTSAFNFAGALNLEKVNYRGTWDDFSKWGEGAKQATTPVKSYPSNAWGLYAMHGNVWEWCADIWQEYLGIAVQTDPWPSTEAASEQLLASDSRVIRGGSWSDFGGDVRSAMRGHSSPAERGNGTGFRLVLGH